MHDGLGLVILALGLALVWAISIWLGRSPASQQSNAGNAETRSVAPRLLSWRAIAAIGCWLIAIEVANEFWFRSREPKASSQMSWTVSWPSVAQGFVRQKLSDDVLALLRSDRSETGVWKKPDGSEWTMFFIKWLPGRMAAQLARGHTPDVCMTGSGFRMVADKGSSLLSAGGAQLPFESYVFEANGKPWFVFFCLHEDRVTPHAALASARDEYLSELEPHNRLRAVWEGKRFHGQQVFEIAIAGYPTIEKARTALEQALPQLVKVEAN